MAKQACVSFSGLNLDLTEIAVHHTDVESALRAYFSPLTAQSKERFVGETVECVERSFHERLAEEERSTVLSLLASLEASLRIDYLQRCYRKKKDVLSNEFRSIHAKKGSRVSLEDEILQAWKRRSNVPPRVISDLKGAFKYCRCRGRPRHEK